MKSFSALVKEELRKSENQSPNCDMAELSGMILFGGTISDREIRFVTESEDVATRFDALCGTAGVKVTKVNSDTARCVCMIEGAGDIEFILSTLQFKDKKSGLILYRIPPELAEDEPCARAFVKGAFMGGGTVIDPNKNYNLEIVTHHAGLSRELFALLKNWGFELKTVTRKSRYVLYTKKSDTISDMLSYMGAFRAQMELINIKIEKEIRNDFNRSANSEAANLDKVIEASVKQIQAIELIEKKIGLDELPDELRELALLRLKNRSESLSALGMMLSPPLGKSGVNRRFQKIISIADKMR